MQNSARSRNQDTNSKSSWALRSNEEEPYEKPDDDDTYSDLSGYSARGEYNLDKDKRGYIYYLNENHQVVQKMFHNIDEAQRAYDSSDFNQRKRVLWYLGQPKYQHGRPEEIEKCILSAQNSMKEQAKLIEPPKDLDDFQTLKQHEHVGEQIIDSINTVDFRKEVEMYKERTEMTMPYTVTNVEDAMYINQKHVITLEYHLFQDSCKYIQLKETGVDKEDIFGLREFGKNKQKSQQFHEKEHQFVTYRENDEDFIIFEGNDLFSKIHENQLSDHQVQGEVARKMNFKIGRIFHKQNEQAKCKKEKHLYCLGILAEYAVTATGTMRRINETNINMGRNFISSKDGNMTLTRSYGKNLVSLVNFNKHDRDEKYFKVKAWSTSLEPHEVKDELNQGMNQYYKDHQKSFNQLVSVTFCGRKHLVELVYLEELTRSESEQKAYLENLRSNLKQKKEMTVEQQEIIGNIGFRLAKKYVFFDVLTGAIRFTYGGVSKYGSDMIPRIQLSDGSSLVAYELGLTVKETREDFRDENDHEEFFHFYVVGDFFHERDDEDNEMIFKNYSEDENYPKQCYKCKKDISPPKWLVCQIFFKKVRKLPFYKQEDAQKYYDQLDGSEGKLLLDISNEKEVSSEGRQVNRCKKEADIFIQIQEKGFYQSIGSSSEKYKHIKCSESLKKDQPLMQWTLIDLEIPQSEILDIKDPEEQRKFFVEQLSNSLPNNSNLDDNLHYHIDQNIVEHSKFNWETNISISTNRLFDTFMIINNPIVFSSQQLCTLYVNGTSFSNQDNKKRLNDPFYNQIAHDVHLEHGRNSYVKNELFYNEINKTTQKSKTIQVQIEHTKYQSFINLKDIHIENHEILSKHDVWMQTKRDFHINALLNIFQTVSVNQGDQYCQLQTRVPTSTVGGIATDYKTVKRSTNGFEQQAVNCPFVAYNLGDCKIMLQNVQQKGGYKSFILDLCHYDHHDNHNDMNKHSNSKVKFQCFVKFPNFSDIGFNPTGLDIELCSHVAFVTHHTDLPMGMQNKLNLLLMDPFSGQNDKLNCVLFKSTNYFDNEFIQENDSVIQAFAQCSKKRLDDENYKLYIWMQTPTKLIRSKMLNPHSLKYIEDSDNTDDEMKFAHADKEYASKLQKHHIECVILLQDTQGFIYYIIHKDGEIQLMEGNPKNPYIKKHESIYNMKGEGIIAFNGNGDQFQIMDKDHTIHNLSRNRNKGERMLQLVEETSLKQIMKLEYLPEAFDEQYIKRNYSIYKSKIYYFHEKQRQEYPDGIMDAEDLIEKQIESEDRVIKNHWMRGPFKFEGSNRFYNVYRKNKFETFMRIFYLPDSTERTLCNDYQNGCDMSTFLQNGKIMVKNHHQFLIFNQSGVFINKVSVEPYENLVMASHSHQLITLAKFYHLSSDLQKEWKEMEDKHNHIKQTFTDFEGKDYNPKSDSEKINDEDNSADRHKNPFKKLQLINFSFNNKFYLFLEKTTGQERFLMFELKIYNKGSGFHEKKKDKGLFSSFKTPDPIVEQIEPENEMNEDYSFVLLYELNVGESKLWLESINEKEDLVSYFKNNNDQVKIDKNGNVSMCYVTTTKVDAYDQDKKGVWHKKKKQVMRCKVRGAIFQRKNVSSVSTCKNFEQEFNFPFDTVQKLNAIIQSRKIEIHNKIKNIQVIQQRLPKAYHDYSEYDNCIQDYRTLEETPSRYVYCKFYFDDLIVLYCGNYVKYGRLYKNPDQGNKNDHLHNHFLFKKQVDHQPLIDLDVIFHEKVQVIKLIETNVNDWVQIVNRNYEKNIITVLTWDFGTNSERSCYQAKPNKTDVIAHNVIKGLNYKLNYLQNQDFIIDLENSIPIKQKNVMQDLNTSSISYRKQLAQINNYYNQRKLNKDGQHTLGIEKAHCMYYNVSRIDLTLWENLSRLHFDLEQVRNTIQLSDCQSIFGGMTIFHLFSGNHELMYIIKRLYKKAITHKALEGTLSSIPLQILTTDYNNNTALQLSVINQSPSAFEIMIDLLEGFPDYSLTKTMLDSMMMILDHSSPKVMNFLENAMFVPHQMQIEQFIPWPSHNTKEIIFPCHTCIVSHPLLLKSIGKEMEWSWPLNHLSLLGFKNPFLEQMQLDVNVENDYEVPEPTATNQNRDGLMVYDLSTADNIHHSDKKLSKKRVTCQAIDMDWLFDHNNAEVLITMISNVQGKDALTKPPIKYFVQMMWSRFQPRIVSYVFVPYLIYLALIMTISGQVVNRFMMSREQILFMQEYAAYRQIALPSYSLNEDYAYKEIQLIHRNNRNFTLSASVFLLSLIVYFGIMELRQYREAGFDYFFDAWNMIDLTSLCLNFSFVSMFFVCVVYDEIYFKRQFILTVASWAVFFMWVKVFYWFRLFRSYAYFVRLIVQTLDDIRPFMIITLVVMLAFANFIYVADQTLPMNDTNGPYAGVYFGNKVLDAVITIYDMGAMLDFQVQPNYTQHNNGQSELNSMLIMWIGATWIVFVVFLNMLIAIMTNTFTDVYENQLPNGLQEQVILMSDHLWLVHTKALFSESRYIMRVAPSHKKPTRVEEHEEAAGEMGDYVGSRIVQCGQKMGERLNLVESNTRYLLDQHYEGLDRTITNLQRLQEQSVEFHQTINADNKCGLQLARKATVKVKGGHGKTAALAAVLKKYIGGQLVEENALRRLVMEWIEVLDRDHSGRISYKEFYLFFANFQDATLNDAQIKELFRSFDSENDKEITVQEFSLALLGACETQIAAMGK